MGCISETIIISYSNLFITDQGLAGLLLTKKMLFADQDAINKLVTKKKLLPYCFNEQHKEKDDTVIRHFSKTLKFFPYFSTLNIKPWMVEEVRNVLHINCFDDILNEYQKVKGEFLYE